MSYRYFPIEFSSYEDYVKYLKEKGFAIEVEENKPIKDKVMEANELMINDLVYNHRNWICPIVEVHKDSAVVIAKYYGEEEFKLNDLRPIPLTPEILEKNGWEERPTGYVFYTDGKRYDNSLWYIFGSNTFVVNNAEFQIKYVHQLQHALRLCGIEKEIIL